VCMTDPIADLLTRVRNAVSVDKPTAVVPFSTLKKNVLQVLKENGFIADFVSEMQNDRAVLRVDLKYGPDGEKVISHIQRVSKPGRRVYRGVKELSEPLNGLGVAILSTPRGVLSIADAKKSNVGGEVLLEVW
jgi:small subunit ribosomal protein S8